MKLLPRDFIETPEGLVFAVVSGTVEDSRALAFLRYAPHHGGRCKLDSAEANAYLRRHHPQYLHYSQSLDSHLHAVPLLAIARHHCPRRRARQLLTGDPREPLERHCRRLLALLVAAGIAGEQLGVTGSLLIGQQHADSDLDLVVYDRTAFCAARAAVRRLIADGELQELDDQAWRDAFRRRNCELELEDFLRHERRKGNKGMIGGRKFDLALVAESGGSEPQGGWRKMGMCTLQAPVEEAEQAFDQPARYRIRHDTVSEIYSFTHTYAGQAHRGELVEACGELEVSPQGTQRLVIGSTREAPGQYLKVLWELAER